MNNGVMLSDDFLGKLTDEEVYLLINMIPKQSLLDPIKKYPKAFAGVTTGLRIDVKSKRLMGRLPKIYFDRIRRYDINIINKVKYNTTLAINAVNDHIFETTSDEKFLEKVLSDNDIVNFDKLIDMILDTWKLEYKKPEYIKLFFKLMGKNISNEQSNYIDTYIRTIDIKKKMEKEISKRLENEYQNKIKAMEEEYRLEIYNQIQKTKEIKEKLYAKNMELSDEKTSSNLLRAQIEEIKIQKNKEIDILQDKIKSLNIQVENMNKKNIKLTNEIKVKISTIEKLTKQIDLKYDEYSIIAQEKWNLEHEQLLNIMSSLDKECEELKKSKVMLNNDIKMLENEKVGLGIKIDEYKNIIQEFIENIDKKLIEKALYDSLLKCNSNNLIQVQNTGAQDTDLYIKKNEKASHIKKCVNIYDFAENIAINLENIGVKKIADEVANYIVGILAAGMTPLICGYKAREIATAISTAYSGETPYIITLPNGYTNSKELLEVYNMTDSNVVLIEDAVGTMNENSLMPLLREKSQMIFSNKLLLLSTENIDSIKYMPHNLFNQVALVMISEYEMGKKMDYENSDAQKVLKEFSSSNDFKHERKVLKRLIRDLKFSIPYEILRANIIAYAKKLSNVEIAFEGYLRSELIFICKCNNMLVDLEQNIQKYQLGDNLIEIVRGALNE